ncbi:uncharacterized protein PRCAT00003856001 [Priceomyces carsonii]|uniref:uncharacterized protein n=1 Tax=Priceomyces carsonii TaxID=28549 RepID=UPI002ED78635|nr:unnamed protein product [Priceomyces carsonii]
MPVDSPEPCKPEACAIQNCLEANGYNESKCSKLIDSLYLCCKQYYEENGDEQTTCCPKLNLLKLKLKQRELGRIDAELVEHRRG